MRCGEEPPGELKGGHLAVLSEPPGPVPPCQRLGLRSLWRLPLLSLVPAAPQLRALCPSSPPGGAPASPPQGGVSTTCLEERAPPGPSDS